MLMTPSPLMSFASRVNFLPLAWVLVSSNFGSSDLEQGRLVVTRRRVAVGRVRRRDQLLEPEVDEVQREELREVAPLRVVAREQDHLVAEDVWVVLQVGVHLALDVGPLGVELVVPRSARGSQMVVIEGSRCLRRHRCSSALSAVRPRTEWHQAVYGTGAEASLTPQRCVVLETVGREVARNECATRVGGST